jgi:hypothetical protein
VKRATGELLILMIAATVCTSIVAAGIFLAIYSLVYPDRDASLGFDALAQVLNTLIGITAGFLAGRTDRRRNGDPK